MAEVRNNQMQLPVLVSKTINLATQAGDGAEATTTRLDEDRGEAFLATLANVNSHLVAEPKVIVSKAIVGAPKKSHLEQMVESELEPVIANAERPNAQEMTVMQLEREKKIDSEPQIERVARSQADADRRPTQFGNKGSIKSEFMAMERERAFPEPSGHAPYVAKVVKIGLAEVGERILGSPTEMSEAVGPSTSISGLASKANDGLELNLFNTVAAQPESGLDNRDASLRGGGDRIPSNTNGASTESRMELQVPSKAAFTRGEHIDAADSVQKIGNFRAESGPDVRYRFEEPVGTTKAVADTPLRGSLPQSNAPQKVAPGLILDAVSSGPSAAVFNSDQFEPQSKVQDNVPGAGDTPRLQTSLPALQSDRLAPTFSRFDDAAAAVAKPDEDPRPELKSNIQEIEQSNSKLTTGSTIKGPKSFDDSVNMKALTSDDQKTLNAAPGAPDTADPVARGAGRTVSIAALPPAPGEPSLVVAPQGSLLPRESGGEVEEATPETIGRAEFEISKSNASASTIAVRKEAQNIHPRSFPQQIANAVTSNAHGHYEIVLDPVELGRVQLSIQPSENGINMAIVAERSDTLETLRRQAEALASEFRELGYRDVSFEFSHQGQGQNEGDAPPEGENPTNDYDQQNDASSGSSRPGLRSGSTDLDIRI